MLHAHHVTVDYVLPLLLFSAGFALAVVDARARDRRNSERSVELQHAAYELGRKVALDRTPVSV